MRSPTKALEEVLPVILPNYANDCDRPAGSSVVYAVRGSVIRTSYFPPHAIPMDVVVCLLDYNHQFGMIRGPRKGRETETEESTQFWQVVSVNASSFLNRDLFLMLETDF